MTDFDAQLERAQADGRITVHDADEVRNFASFLTETAGIPTAPLQRTGEQQRAFWAAYARHYPEDFKRDAPELYAATVARLDPDPGPET